MIPLPQISPEEFVWDNYISKKGFCLRDLFDGVGMRVKLRDDVELLGYCSANRLQVRPRTEGYAVMVLIPETGEKVWAHCPINCL